MPRGDGTGPAGAGSMTGRAAGYCAGYATPGFANPAAGYGRGMAMRRGFRGGGGGGFGRGGGWGFFPQAPAYGAGYPAAAGYDGEAELEQLRTQANHFENSLNAIRSRIDELESSAASEPKKNK